MHESTTAVGPNAGTPHVTDCLHTRDLLYRPPQTSLLPKIKYVNPRIARVAKAMWRQRLPSGGSPVSADSRTSYVPRGPSTQDVRELPKSPGMPSLKEGLGQVYKLGTPLPFLGFNLFHDVFPSRPFQAPILATRLQPSNNVWRVSDVR